MRTCSSLPGQPWRRKRVPWCRRRGRWRHTAPASTPRSACRQTTRPCSRKCWSHPEVMKETLMISRICWSLKLPSRDKQSLFEICGKNFKNVKVCLSHGWEMSHRRHFFNFLNNRFWFCEIIVHCSTPGCQCCFQCPGQSCRRSPQRRWWRRRPRRRSDDSGPTMILRLSRSWLLIWSWQMKSEPGPNPIKKFKRNYLLNCGVVILEILW